MTCKEIIERIKKENISYILLQFTDMLGAIKAVEIPAAKIEDALNNKIMFDGSSIEGFVRIKEADMYLHPDIDTFLVLPFVESTSGSVARMICDVYTPDGKPFEGDPRYVLKRAVEKLNNLGFATMNVGFESEFYLFKLDAEGKPSLHPTDKASYFDLSPFDGGENIRREISLTLEKMGFTIQTSHHEVGPGQNEITFKYDDVISACDKVQCFKQVVKVIARKHGYVASFMPKPLEGHAGNGMHTNCSLFNDKGQNLFYDPDCELQLSMLCRKWMTGILSHSRELSLLTNPIVNSYKRLVSGYEAPIYACWSDANRSSLIRIPAIRGLATRTEIRNVDPCANPYITLAGIIACGLDGITNCPDNAVLEPESDNLFLLTADEIAERKIDHMPETLLEAVREFKNSPILKDTLGEHLFNKYIDAKSREWSEYHNSVSGFEISRYLDR